MKKIIFFIISILIFAGVNVYAEECEVDKLYNGLPCTCPSGTKQCNHEPGGMTACKKICTCQSLNKSYSKGSCNCPSGSVSCEINSTYFSCKTSCVEESIIVVGGSEEESDDEEDTQEGSTTLKGGSQTITADGGGLTNPTGMNTFSELIDKIAEWMLNIGLVLAPLMFVIGGIMFITANGNPSKIQTAQNLLIYTAIGILIILLAKSLVEVLSGFIK